MRFLWVFFVSWAVGGNLLATWFASAGPCYYDTFSDGDNPFVPLFEYLNRADESYEIWALKTQAALLEAHQNSTAGIGAGISAMPSMHVASATLFALVGWQSGRIVGWAFVVFAALIYVGSIHLGWHYAVDGIAGVLLILALWSATGRLLLMDKALVAAGQVANEPSRVL